MLTSRNFKIINFAMDAIPFVIGVGFTYAIIDMFRNDFGSLTNIYMHSRPVFEKVSLLFPKLDLFENALRIHGYEQKVYPTLIVYGYLWAFYFVCLLGRLFMLPFSRRALQIIEEEIQDLDPVLNPSGSKTSPLIVEGIVLVALVYWVNFKGIDFQLTEKFGDRLHIDDGYLYRAPFLLSLYFGVIFYVIQKVYFEYSSGKTRKPLPPE